jgi:Tol biopolymer transport system component
VALSPDGRHAAFVTSPESSRLVVRDLESGVDAPLAIREDEDSPAAILAMNPAWFPGGDRILYVSGRMGDPRIVARPVDGSADPQELGGGAFARVTPDGRWLVSLIDDRGRGRLRRAPIAPDGRVGPAERVFRGADEPDVNWVDISPDSTTLAYAVIEPGGRSNILLTRFPTGSGTWRVTTEGGTRPRFSRDGREIVYAAGAPGAAGRRLGRIMRVPVTLQPSVKLGAPAQVVDDDPGRPGAPSLAWFDVAADGRLLMTQPVSRPAESGARAVLVQNWRRAAGR